MILAIKGLYQVFLSIFIQNAKLTKFTFGKPRVIGLLTNGCKQGRSCCLMGHFGHISFF